MSKLFTIITAACITVMLASCGTARRTPDGLRLFAYPVRELEQLREEPVVDLKNPTLEQAQRALSELAAQKNPCWDIIVQYACPDNSKLSLRCANASIDTRSSTLCAACACSAPTSACRTRMKSRI